MTLNDIPALNACLNAFATVAISLGLVAIKTGHKELHRRSMLSAAAISALFLVGYVTHKILVRGVHTPFGGTGILRGIYYGMLLTHVVLAMAIAWLVPRTFFFAIKGRFEEHRAWARWTMPIWLYVSVTGVLVYLFLYQWWPASR